MPVGQIAAQGPAVELLRQRAIAPASWVEPKRNPFRYGRPSGSGSGAAASSGLPPLPPPDGLPVLPLPLPQPPLRLLGLLTFADGGRVAVMAVGTDLVLARTGEVLAGRFRVGPITDDSVELTDAVGERPIRLALP